MKVNLQDTFLAFVSCVERR